MSERFDTLELRRRIENIGKKPYRNALKFGWLGLCRVSEIVGQSHKSDVGTTPRGPTRDSVEVTKYKGGEPVVLFTVRTSKRGGLPRTAAYPLDPECEPWAEELYNYFNEFSPRQRVFDFTRQKLWRVAHKAFAGLTYPIEEYTRIMENGLIIKHAAHERMMGTHAIRHARAVDLMGFYGFSIQELSVIGGWTLRSMTGASGAISRYAHLGWQSYFPKLLIKRY